MWRARRVVAAVIATAALLAVVPSLVVAADSVTERLIRGLNRQLLYLAVPIAVLVEVILGYAVWRFKDADEPSPTRENRQLELTWTAATAIVLLFVGTASFSVLAHPFVADVSHDQHSHGGHSHSQSQGGDALQPGDAPPDAVEVVVVGEQWEWSFRYPDANVTTDELVLPTDRPVYIYVTAEDVLHSLHVPELGLKQDAFPGQFNVVQTRLLETGVYRLYCAEYCGTGHSEMTATVRVVDPEAYEEWLADRTNGTANASIVRPDSSVPPAGRP